MEFEYYDISPLIHKGIAVFPGDTPFSKMDILNFTKGDHLDLSSITTTLHVGSHVDAPCHYSRSGESIEKRNLKYYLGEAQVIEVKSFGKKIIEVNDLKNIKISAPRVLFKTKSFPNPNEWNSNFMALAPDLIEYLFKNGVFTVGIDTPSVDPETSKDLLAHKCIFKNDMAVIEGIILDDVPEGIYFLISLPLKIKSADASPVRAILLKNFKLN